MRAVRRSAYDGLASGHGYGECKGAYEAAEALADAADRLEGHPAALHLRILSTMAEISAERNCTLLFPLPMEIFRRVGMFRQLQEKAGAGPLMQESR
ncbi:hypothetical protein ACIQ6R_35285 [Streptomyces sp. NPDC096048]|uniref:hypothetical protein n=1 Tax=Streptomyces sp. NPDC096048 TaxID=3366072 RepID=UPI00380B0207